MALIEKDSIFLNLKGFDKKALIEFLGNEMFMAGKLKETDDYIKSVFDREDQVITSVGNGVAIPHGKSKAVIQPTVCFARMSELVDWGDNKEDLVDLIFMIAVPDDDESNDHLRILALLSRKLVDENFRESLRGADTEEVAFELFSEIL